MRNVVRSRVGAVALLSFCALTACESRTVPPAQSAAMERATPPPSQYRMQLLAGAGELALDDFRGKVLLVNFFAAASDECRAEIPELNALHERMQAASFSVVGVAMDLKPQIYVASELRGVLPVFPCAIGGKPARQVFPEIRALPTKWLVDRTGKVVHRYEAAVPLAQVQADLEGLLK